MSFKSNVIILEGAKGFSYKLREYFQGKGASTYIVSKIADSEHLFDELACPILLADLPDSTTSAAKIVEQLKQFEKAHQYPLFILSKNGQKIEEELTPIFKLVTGIKKPVSNLELFEAVKYTSEAFEFPHEKSGAHEQPPATPSGGFLPPEQPAPAPGKISSRAIEPPKRIDSEIIQVEQEAHELYSAFSSIPNLFFDRIDGYQLLNKDFNGIEYTHAINVDAIKDKSYLPAEAKALKAIGELDEKLPPWAKARLHRTSFVSNTIIKHLTDDEKLQETARTASFLCNWAIANANTGLLGKDYITSKSRTVRKDLCSRMKDSAMAIAFDLGLGDAGNMVAKIGRLIGKEEVAGDDAASMLASAIASADMIDRACWNSHYFNPRQAYKIMYMAKSGQLGEIHPAVLCSIIKLLAEAIASSTQVFMVPKELRSDPELVAKARASKEEPVGDNERKVSINELTPGMRLSQPLVAFDGREVLEPDMILDEDLIWRIWQLALIRPLNAPLVVSKKEEKIPHIGLNGKA